MYVTIGLLGCADGVNLPWHQPCRLPRCRLYVGRTSRPLYRLHCSIATHSRHLCRRLCAVGCATMSYTVGRAAPTAMLQAMPVTSSPTVPSASLSCVPPPPAPRRTTVNTVDTFLLHYHLPGLPALMPNVPPPFTVSSTTPTVPSATEYRQLISRSILAATLLPPIPVAPPLSTTSPAVPPPALVASPPTSFQSQGVCV